MTPPKRVPATARVTASARVLLACVLGGLAGCRPLLDLRLASDAERLPAPRFSIEDPSGRGAPLFDFSLEVLEDPSGAEMWSVTCLGGAPSVVVTFGEAPQGYTVHSGPNPLGAGKKYAVYARGTNEGNLHIVVDAAGAVQKDPAFQ